MPDHRDRILQWNVAHAAAMLLALVAVILTKTPLFLILVFSCSLLIYFFRARAQLAGLWGGIGRANWVTLFRLSLVIMVVLLYSELSPYWLVVVLIISVVLDGVDGSIAAYYGERSDFGHYLDIETDAFAISALSILLWHQESFGIWIVLAGVLRYCYVIYVKQFIQAQKLEPKRWYASIIAVTAYVVMTLRLGFDAALLTLFVYIVLLLLVCSFLRSAWYQWQD